MLCLSLQVSASDFEINGVLYTITSFTKLTVRASQISENVTGDVTIPSTETFKGKELVVTDIDPRFAENNNKITSITIGDGVKEIGDEAFRNCSNLSRVTIPESVTRIGRYTFYCCSKLEKVEALGVKTIGNDAFVACENLTSCVFKSLEEIGGSAFAGCGIVSIDLPSTVTTIGRGAFRQCNKLVSFNIPNNVKKIEADIIEYCESLKELTIGNGIDYLPPISRYCPNLEKVRIEDSENTLIIIKDGKEYGSENRGIESIFSGCGLKEVYIGRNIRTVYYSGDVYTTPPFSGLGISKVVIGPYVTSIDMRCKDEYNSCYGNGAFKDCKELTEVIFQSSLIKEIPEEAFRGCNSLITIDLGENLEYIGYRSFFGCDQLSTINVHSPNPPTCFGFSSQHYINTIVNVPPGSLSLYQNTAPWNNFWNLKEDKRLDTGINNASTTINAEELTRYTVNGKKISAPSKGLNIIRYNDGSVKKVVVQ